MGNESPFRMSLTRYWAASLIALLVASNRLWLPSQWTATSAYPSIAIGPLASIWIDSFAFLALPVFGVGCLAIIGLDSDSSCHRRGRFAAWLAIALTMLIGFATDQHRLQPWAYQTVLYAVIWALLPRNQANAFLRVITASIYFYSSIGKFDFQFFHTVGQEFLSTLGSFAGIDVSTWDESLLSSLAKVFPLTELLIAILCVIPATRRLGGVLAIAMHVGLIALLSPWGMNHSWGVLVWNAVLAGQAYLLFVQLERTREIESTSVTSPVRYAAALIITLTVVTMPMTERRGREDSSRWHWDHWLSWALYSPHNSRFHMEVRPVDTSALPDQISQAMGPDPDGDGWRTFNLDQFSLNLRGVPVLPQARYQLQLAIQVAQDHKWENSVRGVVRSASDRGDGTRNEEWLFNWKEMQRAADGYWLGRRKRI